MTRRVGRGQDEHSIHRIEKKIIGGEGGVGWDEGGARPGKRACRTGTAPLPYVGLGLAMDGFVGGSLGTHHTSNCDVFTGMYVCMCVCL